MDFAVAAWLLWRAMRYRIDLSKSRNGYARVNFPGRVLALEASRHVGPVWLVGISDLAGNAPADAPGDMPANIEGSVAVRADSAGEAVWRVARAAVRALAEMTGAEMTGAEMTGAEMTGAEISGSPAQEMVTGAIGRGGGS